MLKDKSSINGKKEGNGKTKNRTTKKDLRSRGRSKDFIGLCSVWQGVLVQVRTLLTCAEM